MAELANTPDVETSTARDDLVRLLTQVQVETPDGTTSGVTEPDAVADAVLEAGWKSPDDTNALTNQATAYNGLMWRLAVAFNLAADGDERIDVDLSELSDRAVTAARASIETDA